MTPVDVNALVFDVAQYSINKGTNAKNLLGTYSLIVVYEYANYPGPIQSNTFTITLSDVCNLPSALSLSPIPSPLDYYANNLHTGYTFTCPVIPNTVCQ